MSCLREVQTISQSPNILPMPSLTRLTTGGVLNPLKNTTKIGHNELLHQEPLQPPLEPRTRLGVLIGIEADVNHALPPDQPAHNYVGYGILCYLAKHMTSRSH